MAMNSASCIFYPWAWGENVAIQFKSTSAQFPSMATCMWPMAKGILEHPISQVKQYDALWKSLCQGRKAEERWEGYSCFTKSTNCSQTQKRLSTGWLQKEFNIPFSRVNDADQRSCVWKDKLSPVPFTSNLEGKSVRDHYAAGTANPHFCGENTFFFPANFLSLYQNNVYFYKGKCLTLLAL